MQQFITARLGLKPHDKAGIALDIDCFNRIHLDGDDAAHRTLSPFTGSGSGQRRTQMRPKPANCDHLQAWLDPAGLPGQMMRYVVSIVVGYNLAEFLPFAIPVSQS